VGIPTSWDLDTLEGLESLLSGRIHRIPAALPHSTELELRKLYRILTDSSRASGPQNLASLYSRKNELGSTIGS
jgi:hypothetical protein